MRVTGMHGNNYLNRPEESSAIHAINIILHPNSGDESDMKKALNTAVNALRYVLHEIKSDVR